MTQARLFPLPPLERELDERQRARNADAARRIVEILEQQDRAERALKGRKS